MKKSALFYLLKKTTIMLMVIVFTIGSVGVSYAQSVVPMSASETMVALSKSFAPPLLKGVRVYADNPFRLDFILDKGEDVLSDNVLRTESERLIRYFLASVTVPEDDLWVNLSPYEKDRIVPDAFGVTQMGRDLLAQDYILKQITASVIYPEGEVGKAFWAKIYAEAEKHYGTTDIPIDIFNKVWIVPEKAVVYEGTDSAYVVESRLKVMLETDYLAMSKNAKQTRGHSPRRGASRSARNTSDSQTIAQEVLREIIVPILEKEVNEGKNFAQLRQLYHSLILAVWYKDKVKESLFGKAYVDQKKIVGVDIEDKAEKEKIWAQYVEAFKEGSYNYIKESIDPVTQQSVPRKYFSGGVGANKIREVYTSKNVDRLDSSELAMLSKSFDCSMIQVELDTAQEKVFKRAPGLSVEIPKPVDIPEIMLERRQDWLNKAGNDRTRKIRQFLLDHVVRISFADFQKALFDVVDKFNQSIPQKPYAVLWNEAPGGSRRWVYEIVKDRLVVKPVDGLYYDATNKQDRMGKKLRELSNRGINTFVIFDDAAYSGHQILQTLKSIKLLLPGRKINIIVVVPYYTTAAKSVWGMFKTYKKKTGANVDLVTFSTQHLPSVNDLLSAEDFEYLYKNQGVLTQEDAEDLPMSPVIAIWTLTYFDFKLPDELSFMEPIRRLFAPQVIAPYKIKETPYGRAEEADFMKFLSDASMGIKTLQEKIKELDIKDQEQIIKGKERLQALAMAYPQDAHYLEILADSLVDIHTRKKTHVVNVVENAYRFINFSDDDVAFFFSRLKEVKENEDMWSLEERMSRFEEYKKELKKVRDLYSQMPKEYQRMLIPLAIFHDIGALSPIGDLRWRGKGIPDLDQQVDARDWVHHAIGAGIILRLEGIQKKDVDLLATLVFHHGAIPNVGIDFFKDDILNKFNKFLRDLFTVFFVMDMSSRQDGINAADKDLISVFIENVNELPQMNDEIFVERRVSRAFGVPSFKMDVKERSKRWAMVLEHFKQSRRHIDLIKNWKRARVNQFDLFVRLARISPQAYAELLAQISDEISKYLKNNEEFFIDTDVDFLRLPFGEGNEQQRVELTEIIYQRVLLGKPLLFEIKEQKGLDFRLQDKENPLSFVVEEKKTFVFEIQLNQMKQEEQAEQAEQNIRLENTGGIDLTRDKMDLQVSKDGQRAQFKFDFNQIQQQNFLGLIPNIINFQSVTITILEFMSFQK